MERPNADLVCMPSLRASIARELRRNMNQTEWRLWSRLRVRQLAGWKFRRQHPLGRHILDFYCIEKKLAVEADGGQHLTPEESGRKV